MNELNPRETKEEFGSGGCGSAEVRARKMCSKNRLGVEPAKCGKHL